MHSVTKKDIIKYAVFPGFRQRFSDLFASGFQYVPYFMALVYRAVRLLPENHPYLSPSNMGRFGVRHVIAEAANNIVFSRNNIDQILLFATILIGVVLVILQLFLLGTAIFFQPAMAGMPTNFQQFFLTPPGSEAQDIAHIMLDMVFGVPGLFDSCVSTAAPCLNVVGDAVVDPYGGATSWALEPTAFPTPLNQGLHQLFRLYNTGLLVVGVLIAIYFILTILAETAQSGTPFGRRFNKVWAPIRFVVAFGLLVPITFGYNSSQYIVLYAAKFGSGFATNGWNIFNDELSAAFSGGLRNLLNTSDGPGGTIAEPNIPEVGSLLQFLYSAKVCQHSVALSKGLAGNPDTFGSAVTTEHVKMYLVSDPFATPNYRHVPNLLSVPYDDLWTFVNAGVTGGNNIDTVVIRFGSRDESKYGLQRGYVNPTCGELVLKLTDPRDPTCTGGNCAEVGVEAMQRYYWYVIKELWFEVFEGVSTYPPLVTQPYARNLVRKTAEFTRQPAGAPHDPNLTAANARWRIDLNDFYRRDLRNAMINPGATGLTGIIQTGAGGAIEAMELSNRWDINAGVRDKGWVGASVWYNRIAEMNGAMTSAVLNIPLPNRYPEIMEKVYQEKLQREENINPSERFNPESTNASATGGMSATERKIAGTLWLAFKYWQEGDGTTSSHTAPSGNIIIDIINATFGTEGLFDMRRNDGVHPLAKLTGVGRGLIEASVRNLGLVAIGGAAGVLDNVIGNLPAKEAIRMASSFLLTFAMITLTAGFILFYIVPFLPFIYFFFAFGGWIKGIFEAMVGAPLWALAHLRIDGPGLAGQAAVSGYFLIFEVFLRPILIIFGLLASISIFSALVSVLNQTFDLVVQNTGGFDIVAELGGIGAPQIAVMRSAIDQFFYTAVYTIIVYLMGMSSFKLVDLIPNNILRWMNQSVATFGDQREDSGQSLVGTSTLGAQQTLSTVGGGIQGFFKAKK